jgi:hypothetical protein
MADDNDWEDVPKKKAGGAATATADGDWEDVPAKEEKPAEEATEENLPGSTPQLREAVNKGVAKMQPPTQFEKDRPQIEPGYGFGDPNKMEIQQYAGLPSRHVIGAMAKGAKDVIGSGLQGAYDLTLGQANPETGELEHGLGGLVGLNTKGEFAPGQRITALGKKYLTEPAGGEIEKAKEEAAQGHTMSAIGHGAAAALPLVGPWAASLGERAGTGDIGGAAGEAAGGVLGGEAMGHPAEVAGGVKAIGKAGLDALGNPLSLGLEGHESITKGVRPRARAQGWQEAVQSPGVQRAILDYNAQTPINSVEDFHDAIPVMKEKLWNEQVQPALDRQGPRPVDMQPAADAVRKAITPEMREFDPNGVAQLEQLAGQLEKSRTVKEASDLRKYANAQLESYFSKYPSARRSAFANTPETMGWETARRAIMDQLDKKMTEIGETEAAPARRDYGHLTTLEKELERKVNPNERKNPTGLYNFLGTAGGIGALLAGHGLAGAALYGYGRLAEHFNKPDVLIRRGIANLKPPEAAPFTPPEPYHVPDIQFPEGQGAVPPSTAPLQNAAQPPGNFAMESLRPNQTAMWQQQVGAPPPLESGAPSAPYREPIGPQPAPEAPIPPIRGQQAAFNLPSGPEEAPLWNLRPINAPRNFPETPRLPGTFNPPVGMEEGAQAPQAIGGPGREGAVRPMERPGGRIQIGEGEDLGEGMGTEHIITVNGQRVGSVTVEPTRKGTLHVHWLGGDFGKNIRPVIEELRKQYPDVEKLTYDRRRVAKGAKSATTERRTINLKGPRTDWEGIASEVNQALEEEGGK